MASLIQWTWVWVNSGSWCWTGRPGVLQSMGSQRVRHDWMTELNWFCSQVKRSLWVTLAYLWRIHWENNLYLLFHDMRCMSTRFKALCQPWFWSLFRECSLPGRAGKAKAQVNATQAPDLTSPTPSGPLFMTSTAVSKGPSVPLGQLISE